MFDCLSVCVLACGKDALLEKEKLEEFLREFGELDTAAKAGADPARAPKSKQGRRGKQVPKARPKSCMKKARIIGRR